MANVRRILASGLTRLGLIPYSELDLANQIQSGDIQAGAITGTKIAADAVDSSHIQANAVGASEIADNSVGTNEITDNAVTSAKIPANAVGSTQIAASAVTDAKIASGVAVSKLAGGTDGQVLGHSGGLAVWADVGTLPPTSATARFAGEVTWHAGTATPSGWLPCDGSSLLLASYPDLFAAIGTSFGASDGTHFNVPDIRNRVLRGSNDGTVGATGGNDSVTLSTGQLPSHAHDGSALTVGSESGHTHGPGTFTVSNAGQLTTGTESSDHSHSGSTSASGDHQHGGTGGPNNYVGGSNNGYAAGAYYVGQIMVSAIGHVTSAAGNHAHSFTTGGRSAAHTHQVPDHGHSFSGVSAAGSAHTHSLSGTTGSVGSGSAVDIKPQHIILRPLIKT